MSGGSSFCGGCKFFHDMSLHNEEREIGFCRRNAPRTNGGALVVWPMVNREEDWCGEFCREERLQ